MFENFKVYSDVDLPDYVACWGSDDEGVYVSVLTDNLSSFNDWVVSKGIKVEMV